MDVGRYGRRSSLILVIFALIYNFSAVKTNGIRIQRSMLNSSGYSLLDLDLLLVSYKKYISFLHCTVRRKLFCCLQ